MMRAKLIIVMIIWEAMRDAMSISHCLLINMSGVAGGLEIIVDIFWPVKVNSFSL